ncbi:MAG: arginine biosynthesis bifunctional protein ArgJ [Ignavibacteria bacterium]|nr:MAG: arginine biosynthesis bifunctional protein ArgJ [Ignavibacteria bacterium]KAF0160789.1 MAG: arginine biosynthesis bifunctional protein ArgJ [Ignavibacteria bacterium]
MFQEKLIESKVNKGITTPKGFKSVGIHCGIKKSKKDLALIVSDFPATAAGVFTLNKVQAAPVLVCKENLTNGDTFRAIVCNSGNANACTGEKGYQDAANIAKEAANALGINAEEVFVSSTGVIGEKLPMDKVIAGIKKAAKETSENEFLSAAEAIMTTDTFVKSRQTSFMLNGIEVSIGGIAKGSGMIHPNMATMLGFITTDASIEKQTLQKLLSSANKKTFNRIVVDGDTSTNDMVIMLANGASGIRIEDGTKEYNLFEEELFGLLKNLSMDIVKDGEGATKLIEITVDGALTDADAEKAARTVALSPLVKTAIYGEDANWGRILAAVGYSGIEFNPDKFEITINEVKILKQNYFVTLPNAIANQTLKAEKINLLLELHFGEGKATCWTCDFSEEYVKINGSYRT